MIGNPYYWGAPVKPPHSGIRWFWIMVIIAAAGGGIFAVGSLMVGDTTPHDGQGESAACPV